MFGAYTTAPDSVTTLGSSCIQFFLEAIEAANQEFTDGESSEYGGSGSDVDAGSDADANAGGGGRSGSDAGGSRGNDYHEDA